MTNTERKAVLTEELYQKESKLNKEKVISSTCRHKYACDSLICEACNISEACTLARAEFS